MSSITYSERIKSDYDHIRVARSSAKECSLYGQVVVIAQKVISANKYVRQARCRKMADLDRQFFNHLTKFEDLDTLNDLIAEGVSYQLPRTSLKPRYFYSDYIPVASYLTDNVKQACPGFQDLANAFESNGHGLNQRNSANLAKLPVNLGQLGLLLVAGDVRGEVWRR